MANLLSINYEVHNQGGITSNSSLFGQIRMSVKQKFKSFQSQLYLKKYPCRIKRIESKLTGRTLVTLNCVARVILQLNLC